MTVYRESHLLGHLLFFCCFSIGSRVGCPSAVHVSFCSSVLFVSYLLRPSLLYFYFFLLYLFYLFFFIFTCHWYAHRKPSTVHVNWTQPKGDLELGWVEKEKPLTTKEWALTVVLHFSYFQSKDLCRNQPT